MLIDEAIKILVKLQIDDLPLPRHLDWQAVQLGIEAMGQVKRCRELKVGFYADLLPSETEK